VVYEPKNAKNTILFFGGRSHDVVGLVNKLSQAYPNTRVITFNYRSYGRSAGVANEKNLLNDAISIAKIIQKYYGDFYLLGFSLGSSIASYVAMKHKVKGVFLVGAFDSIASLAKSKYMLNISRMYRYKFKTYEYVQHIEAPVYLFVSKNDEITYIKNARELKKYIKNLTYYKEFDGLTHKSLLWDYNVRNKIREVVE
jgi:pimeloyl-ACP methyl ester carboxylesterase